VAHEAIIETTQDKLATTSEDTMHARYNSDGYPEEEQKWSSGRGPSYVYEGKDGAPYLRVTRMVRSGKKSFPQQHRENGQWVSGAPKGPAIPYRLPELIAAPDAPVFIAEGEKDAESVASLGLTATTNPGGGTRGKWVKELNKWFARRVIYILEDNDATGRNHVQEVAGALADLAEEIWVIRFAELPEHGDVSDWLEQGGTKEQLFARAEKLGAPGKKTRLRFFRDGGEAPEPPQELIADTVPAEGFMYIGGQSGAGKTFILVYLAVCLAASRPFFGREVKERVGVVILAAEGSIAKLKIRISAAKKYMGIEHDLPIAWCKLSDNLLDAQVQADVTEDIKAEAAGLQEAHGTRLGAVVIDTEGAAYEIDDEDDAANAVARIGTRIGAAVAALAVHVHESGNRSLAITKLRDGEEGPIGPFELVPIVLGPNVRSCAVEFTPQPIVSAKVKAPTKANATALRALYDCIAEVGEIPPKCDKIPAGVKCCTKDQWKEYAIKRGVSSSKEAAAERVAFKRAYDNLVGPNVDSWEEWVWPIV
jgi:AAA domain